MLCSSTYRLAARRPTQQAPQPTTGARKRFQIIAMGQPVEEPTEKQRSRCQHCEKRTALAGCTQFSCLHCCTDEACERHQKSREQAAWKDQVLAGTTDVQQRAKVLRNKALQPGRFREPGFAFQGDTVVIWNVREYAANSKWREDAVRKSLRRQARRMDGVPLTKPLRNNRRRFHRIMERLHQQSIA